MEIAALILIGMIIYLFKDNKKQAVENKDPIDRAWKLGSGWLIIIVAAAALFFSVIPFMATGKMPYVGLHTDDSGHWIVNPATPPPPMPTLGELMGLHEDDQGHWTR